MKSGFAVLAQESIAKDRGVGMSAPTDPLLEGTEAIGGRGRETGSDEMVIRGRNWSEK